ncbi:MAG: phenylpyruvate tautomerase MIF-related protein [Candidatus Methylacidiphilales bacterium]
MPLILFKTNKFLSDGGSDAAALEISKIVADLLKKDEKYVQVIAQGDCAMSFAGTTDPTALVELYSIGLDQRAASVCSEKISAFIQRRFDIPVERIFLIMSDHPKSMWGWNGRTFA